jgi:hypothetical protein
VIYRAYGLTLTSAVPIPALNPLSSNHANTDIHLELGTPPPDWVDRALTLHTRILPIRRSVERDSDSQFTLTDLGNGRYFQLRYADGTRFLIDEKATRIWAEAGPDLTVEDAIVYLLGPVMGFALRRRGRTPLHAGALVFGHRAVAFMGSAGAGKSTTAAALALRGWPVLCEDVCALDESEGTWHVLPGYPRVCLWPDSVDRLFASKDALPLIVQGWEKRYLPLDGSRAHFAQTRLPLAAIYLLAQRSDDESAPRIDAMSKKDAALHLVQNTYMNWLLDRDQRAAEFDAIVRLLSQVECFRVTPSADPAHLGRLAICVESHAMQYSRLSARMNSGATSHVNDV